MLVKVSLDLFWIASISLAVLVFSATVAAQAPVGTVGGSVSDFGGAFVPNAEVSVRQPGTGAERKTSTNGSGDYQLANLPPGSYIVEAQKQGFRTEWRRLTLRVGDHLTVDFSLEPGSPTERVEIVGEIPVVNTTEYKVAGSVSRSQVESLPLNGRNFLELAQLEPSVQVVSVTNPGALGNNFQQVLFGGAYYTQTRISVDGSTVGDRFAGGTTLNFSQESVQEFEVPASILISPPEPGPRGPSTSSLVRDRMTCTVRPSITSGITTSGPTPGSRATRETSTPSLLADKAGSA